MAKKEVPQCGPFRTNALQKTQADSKDAAGLKINSRIHAGFSHAWAHARTQDSFRRTTVCIVVLVKTLQA